MGKSKQKSKISVGKITNRSALLAIVGSWRYPGSFNQQVNELKKVARQTAQMPQDVAKVTSLSASTTPTTSQIISPAGNMLSAASNSGNNQEKLLPSVLPLILAAKMRMWQLPNRSAFMRLPRYYHVETKRL